MRYRRALSDIDIATCAASALRAAAEDSSTKSSVRALSSSLQSSDAEGGTLLQNELRVRLESLKSAYVSAPDTVANLEWLLLNQQQVHALTSIASRPR